MPWRLLEALCLCPGAYWKRFAYALALIGSALLMPWCLLYALCSCSHVCLKCFAYAMALVFKRFADALALVGNTLLMPGAYWKHFAYALTFIRSAYALASI